MINLEERLIKGFNTEINALNNIKEEMKDMDIEDATYYIEKYFLRVRSEMNVFVKYFIGNYVKECNENDYKSEQWYEVYLKLGDTLINVSILVEKHLKELKSK